MSPEERNELIGGTVVRLMDSCFVLIRTHQYGIRWKFEWLVCQYSQKQESLWFPYQHIRGTAKSVTTYGKNRGTLRSISDLKASML